MRREQEREIEKKIKRERERRSEGRKTKLKSILETCLSDVVMVRALITSDVPQNNKLSRLIIMTKTVLSGI